MGCVNIPPDPSGGLCRPAPPGWFMAAAVPIEPKPVRSAKEGKLVPSRGPPLVKSVCQPEGAIAGDEFWLMVVPMGLYPPFCDMCSLFMRGDKCEFEGWLGCGVAELAVAGRGVCTGADACGVAAADAVVAAGFAAAAGWSWPFLFRLMEFSFSALSITTLAIRSNSEHTPSIRWTPPVSASWPSMDRKLTTRFMSLVSDLALGSIGFCRMLPNRVTRAVTGKYKINLRQS